MDNLWSLRRSTFFHPYSPFAKISWEVTGIDSRISIAFAHGKDIFHNGQVSFQNISTYKCSSITESQSVRGPRNGWRPFTPKAPYLLSVSFVSLALVAILESLSRKSRDTSGVVLANQDGHFTTLHTFGLLYLPTVIAVIYNLAWGWIELDVKRLKPYFQLSRVDEALSEWSLLLKYPIEYIPTGSASIWGLMGRCTSESKKQNECSRF